jgi:hypothetical protein
LRNTDNKWGKDSRKRKVEKNVHGLPPVVGGTKKNPSSLAIQQIQNKNG